MTADEIPMRVAEIVPLTADIRAFRLVATDGRALPAFSGGAHITLLLSSGARQWRNAYSLTGRPGDTDGYTIAVRREAGGRGGSRFLHEAVSVGDEIAVLPPANAFALVATARHHLFIAGGIGITPFLPMAEQAAAQGQDFELHYAARSAAEAAFGDALAARFGNRVTLYASDAGSRMDLARLVSGRPLGTHLYVCGPSRLIEAAFDAARAAAWPESALHAEAFTPPPTGDTFAVTVAASGQEIAVGAEQSLLEALEAAGIDVPNVCRGGACGACFTDVKECDGTILHNDHYLSPDERESGTCILPCVSRFAGRRLVLDL